MAVTANTKLCKQQWKGGEANISALWGGNDAQCHSPIIVNSDFMEDPPWGPRA